MTIESATEDWPFEDPPNVAVITTRHIFNGKPILSVCRYEDDGSWGFYSGDDITEADAMVVALREIVERDASIKELVDLPYGWSAERNSVKEPWQRVRPVR